MKKEYINEQKQELERKIKNVNNRTDLIDVLSVLGIFVSLPIAFISLFSIPVVALAASETALLCLFKKYKNKKMNEEEIKKLKQEIEHLTNISENTPESNNLLNNKRKRRITELEKEKKDLEDQHLIKSAISKVSFISVVGSTIGSLLVPAAAPVLFPLIASGIYAVVGKSLLKSKTKIENLDNRITNLVNDLVVIACDKKDNPGKYKKVETPVQQNSNGSVVKKTNNNPRPLPQRKPTSNEQAVNAYIRNLENAKTNSKPVQKVKK